MPTAINVFEVQLLSGTISIVVGPNRKCGIQNGVFQTGRTNLSLQTTQEQNFNGYTNVFGVKPHGETSGNTVRCLDMSKIKDGGV